MPSWQDTLRQWHAAGSVSGKDAPKQISIDLAIMMERQHVHVCVCVSQLTSRPTESSVPTLIRRTDRKSNPVCVFMCVYVQFYTPSPDKQPKAHHEKAVKDCLHGWRLDRVQTQTHSLQKPHRFCSSGWKIISETSDIFQLLVWAQKNLQKKIIVPFLLLFVFLLF